MYALLFTMYLITGQQYDAVIKYFDDEQACTAQALRYHVGMNRLPVTLGTEHRCLPVVPEVDEEK